MANTGSLLELLAEHAYEWRLQPVFTLSSGSRSTEYLDCKRALSQPGALKLLGEVLHRRVDRSVVAVGGLTMGADPLSLAVSYASSGTKHPVRWFSIRKEPKEHGTKKQIEGMVSEGEKVAVFDDVVTSGAATMQAVHACQDAKLEVVQVVVLVDREDGDGIKRIRDEVDCPVDVIFKKRAIRALWKVLHSEDKAESV